MLFDNRRHATYQGDQTENVGTILGPNLFGEYQTIDEVDHDPGHRDVEGDVPARPGR